MTVFYGVFRRQTSMIQGLCLLLCVFMCVFMCFNATSFVTLIFCTSCKIFIILIIIIFCRTFYDDTGKEYLLSHKNDDFIFTTPLTYFYIGLLRLLCCRLIWAPRLKTWRNWGSWTTFRYSSLMLYISICCNRACITCINILTVIVQYVQCNTQHCAFIRIIVRLWRRSCAQFWNTAYPSRSEEHIFLGTAERRVVAYKNARQLIDWPAGLREKRTEKETAKGKETGEYKKQERRNEIWFTLPTTIPAAGLVR